MQIKSFARLFKGGGYLGQRPEARSAERETLFLRRASRSE